ncbi:Transposon Tf2-11 polyprotein [Smittium culicis]|uniref:Transposon Tf2-11 polyprotein n=1 Tax=Smittium culicis TaxID=133412 RepID=A0A1R1XZL4_9FUNG|nr:Transposon Tf2-11 polyprotein [Smittium culicis]
MPLKGRVGRWAVALASYDFQVLYRPGSKNPADYLSRFPWENSDLKEETVNVIQVSDFLNNNLEETTKQTINIGKYNIDTVNLVKKIHSYSHRNAEETNKILSEQYGMHGCRKLIDSIVKECEICQRVNYTERKASLFNIVKISSPFNTWGVDVAGPLPRSIKGNKYIIVGIDYFTRWPVAKATKEINSRSIQGFIEEEIIRNFGTPKKLVTDRGTHFVNKGIVNFLKTAKIELETVSAYRPMGNGQVERTIQTLKQILRKNCFGNSERWDEYIWKSLLAMRTSNNRTIGRTSVEMVYGMKLMTPELWDRSNPNFS